MGRSPYFLNSFEIIPKWEIILLLGKTQGWFSKFEQGSDDKWTHFEWRAGYAIKGSREFQKICLLLDGKRLKVDL